VNVGSVIVAVLILSFIIVAHEFGHYIAARKNGVLVEEFAIGMGPKLFGKKIGDTLWAVRLFPIGGFCKMLGDDEENSDPRAFNAKKLWRRLIIISAGVIMNVVLALAITCTSSLANGFAVPVIKNIIPDSPAEKAGLRSGDRITRLNDSGVHIYSDVSFFMAEATGSPIDITVLRDKQKLTFQLTPRFVEYTDGSQAFQIGFERDWHTPFFGKTEEGLQRAGFFESLYNGFFTAGFYVKSTFLGFIRMFTLQIKASELAGPIGIVSIIGENYTEAAKAGVGAMIWTMLNFMALISANLAVANILPLPTLDGGRLVFLAIEGIRRKPVDPNKEGMVHFAGFILLMIFAVFVAYNDIMRMI
jgi:regulator of sigma E protease